MKVNDLPVNVSILVPSKEQLMMMKPVRVLDILDGGTNNYHEDGLFSVSIFGRQGSEERDERFSFISLNTDIFHPFIFKQLLKLKALYGEIIAGRKYAIWNTENNDFEVSDAISGSTGYSFFCDHWRKIIFKGTGSAIRDLRLALIGKYKETATTKNVLVLPAGLRDIEVTEDGRIKQEEINDEYRKLISIGNTINTGGMSDNTILDNSRYSMQLTFNRIFDYFSGLLEGKGGFLQRKWGARRIYNGTRNVITAMDTSPPILGGLVGPRINNTVIGLYQLAKGALPKTKHYLLSGWLSHVFNGAEGNATLINASSLRKETVKVKSDVIDRWTTTAGLDKVINSFSESSVRSKPIKINGYYIGLVYRGPDNTFKIFGDINDLPAELDRKHVHPLTFCELLYLSGYQEWNKLGVYITRYPVTGVGSIYPSFAYVKTTVKSLARRELGEDWKPIEGDQYLAIEYPDFTCESYVNALTPHVSRLALMGGDFDGDMTSANIVYSDESLAELYDMVTSVDFYRSHKGGLLASPFVDTISRVLFNMTGD